MNPTVQAMLPVLAGASLLPYCTALWRGYRNEDEYDRLNRIGAVCYALGSICWGADAAFLWVNGKTLFFAIIETIISFLWGFVAYTLWKRRKRKKKPARVLGVVKNVGHRLVIAPIPQGGTT